MPGSPLFISEKKNHSSISSDLHTDSPTNTSLVSTAGGQISSSIMAPKMPSSPASLYSSQGSNTDSHLNLRVAKRDVKGFTSAETDGMNFQLPNIEFRTDTEFRPRPDPEFRPSPDYDPLSEVDYHDSDADYRHISSSASDYTSSDGDYHTSDSDYPVPDWDYHASDSVVGRAFESATPITTTPGFQFTDRRTTKHKKTETKKRPNRRGGGGVGGLRELARRVEARLTHFAHTTHMPHPRLGLDYPLDPLNSSSTLRYKHEGDLLQLRLVLENVTLVGLSSLSVQEVNFVAGRGGTTGQTDWDGVAGEGEEHHRGPGGGGRGLVREGVVRVAFREVQVRAKYQVRGSARGFLTFKESGDLILSSPTVFLISHLTLSLPPPPPPSGSTLQRRRHGGSRVKVVRVRTEVLAPSSLTLQPTTSPPKWVRQQVQTKLFELTRDLSHGHGAVRLLLRRWGRALKRLTHRTARTMHHTPRTTRRTTHTKHQ
ncbi:hypothetical protein Pcinc_038238 [Petrolisthes cinctipes]|uniref:Uncharacterized protein n=1 Tax=Petrolisthes cinctipes TaxID=88211 RepID=A0AAE1BR56_PETCI|nr:hypothetical protein Pcinc_038238 [Petrolisthes cinctipes]